jgi:hypothetical protein
MDLSLSKQRSSLLKQPLSLWEQRQLAAFVTRLAIRARCRWEEAEEEEEEEERV